MTPDRMTARDVIAVALNAMPADGRPVELVDRDRATRALVALKAAGYAVVELPAPTERETDDEVTTRWEGALPFTVDVWDDYPNEVGLAYDFNPFEPFTPNGARTLAAALLAAADAAEEGK